MKIPHNICIIPNTPNDKLLSSNSYLKKVWFDCFSKLIHFLHNVIRDYKYLLQENRRTRIYETCTDRRSNSIFFPPVSCFSSQFTFLSLGDTSVCSEKMAAPGQKSFCVFEYHTSKSVVTVQRAFRAQYAKDPPTDNTICAWYKQFTETGCLCKQKAPMLTHVCGKNLNIVSMCAVSPWCTRRTYIVVKKNCFSFPVAVSNSIKVGPLVFLL